MNQPTTGNQQPDQSLYSPTFYARQPVFTEDKRIWGYELLYRHGPEDETALFEDKDAATLNVLVNAISWPRSDALSDARVLVNFPPRCLLDNIPYALSPANVMLQVPEQTLTSPGLPERLHEYRQNGFQIAIDDYQGRAEVRSMLFLADVLIIDVLKVPGETVQSFMSRAQGFSGKFLAKRVEDGHRFIMSRGLGCSLFQGFFFRRPELVSGRKLTTSQMSRLQLLGDIERSDPDLDSLAKKIQNDVSLSFRLLCLVNSAAFGLRKEVQSIHQAIVLLGWMRIRSWLRLVLLTDLASRNSTSELPYLSVLRARFLEEASRRNAMEPGFSDTLYLLGLFSLLEPMLCVPAREIIPELPLPRGVSQALCGEQSEYTPWLDLIQGFEGGDWAAVDETVALLGLDPVLTAHAYYDAMTWTNGFFDVARKSSSKAA